MHRWRVQYPAYVRRLEELDLDNPVAESRSFYVVIESPADGPLIEIVSKPLAVVPGDVGRPTPEEFFHDFTELRARLAQLGDDLADDPETSARFEDFFAAPEFLLSPAMRDAVLVPAPGVHDRIDHHLTAGIPVSELHGFLSYVHDSAPPGMLGATLPLKAGLDIGNEAAALYLRDAVSELAPFDPRLVALAGPAVEIAEVRGFLALVYTQVYALGSWDAAWQAKPENTYMGVVKSYMTVASRVSLAGIRASLSNDVQRFLARHADEIKDMMRQRATSELPTAFPWAIPPAQLAWFNLLNVQLASMPSISTWLDTALTPQPAHVLAQTTQNVLLGMHTTFETLDTNEGRLELPLALIELRYFGPEGPSNAVFRRLIEQLANAASNFYGRALNRRTTPVAELQHAAQTLQAVVNTARFETRALHTLLAAVAEAEPVVRLGVRGGFILSDEDVRQISQGVLAVIALRNNQVTNQTLTLIQSALASLNRAVNGLAGLVPPSRAARAALEQTVNAARQLRRYLDPEVTRAADGRNISRLRNDVNLQLHRWNQPAVDDTHVLNLYNRLPASLTSQPDNTVAYEIAGLVVDPNRALRLPGG
ncbi:hypothetical protein KUM39_27890, partial [Streptomyces sp. J2-1]|uniref:hypothetical protein n=1 Tax=Streptomyces corallincola TaxID=2851888 RepID=UPI001C391012